MAAPDCLADLNLTTVFPNTFAHTLFIYFRGVAMQRNLLWWNWETPFCTTVKASGNHSTNTETG